MGHLVKISPSFFLFCLFCLVVPNLHLSLPIFISFSTISLSLSWLFRVQLFLALYFNPRPPISFFHAFIFTSCTSPLTSYMSDFPVFLPPISPDLPSLSILLLPPLLLQEFRQKVMLGTPFVVIWLVGFIADLDIDSWLIKGLMYAGVWVAVQFLSKYVSTQINYTRQHTYHFQHATLCSGSDTYLHTHCIPCFNLITTAIWSCWHSL